MSSRVEIAKDQPDEFVMPGESGPAQPVADVTFVKERGVGYLLYRAESRNGNHKSEARPSYQDQGNGKSGR